MFTGLVTSEGRLARARRSGGGLRLGIVHALPGGPLIPGESVSVDGCCLTVDRPAERVFEADLSPETLARTGGAGRWRPGRRVNLERALQAGDRLGGHIVQGHAEGLVRLIALRRASGGWLTARLALPAAWRRLVVEKGSVALDGISLTVSAKGSHWFEVALIPATLAQTTLARRRAGDSLIVEFDILAKYAESRGGPAEV